MKKVILLILLGVSMLMANSTKVTLPTFLLDVNYSQNATEQLIERNEVVTLRIKVLDYSESKKNLLLKKEIILSDTALLKIDDLMVNKKYSDNLDNLVVKIDIYSTPSPFEEAKAVLATKFSIKEGVQNLKNRKYLLQIKVEDDINSDNY